MGETSELGLLSASVAAVPGATAAGGEDTGDRDMVGCFLVRSLLDFRQFYCGEFVWKLFVAWPSTFVFAFQLDAAGRGFCLAWLAFGGSASFWVSGYLGVFFRSRVAEMSAIYICLCLLLMFGDCVRARCSDGLKRGQHGLFDCETH